MRAALLAGILASGLAACAGGPTAPEWQANTHQALAGHTRAYLAGRDRIAAQELALARREVARTGDATALARVELTACALKFASLAGGDCPAFAPLAGDADAASSAYAAYLAGRWPEADPALLPPTQAEVVRGRMSAEELAAIADPVSQLVAAAALLGAGRLSPAGIAIAIETAAAQGWARPLAAWLTLDRERLRAAGDEAGAAARQRRIDRVLQGPR